MPLGFTDPRANGPCVGYLHLDTVDLLPGALVGVRRDAQRRAGAEPNLTRTRLARLWHERNWLPKGKSRGTYGTRRRIGTRQMPVWPLPVSVLYPDNSSADLDPETVKADRNMQAVRNVQATLPEPKRR